MKIVFAIAFSTAVPAMLLAGATRLLPDAKTSFLVAPQGGKIVDVSGRISADKIGVKDIDVEKDPVFGEVMVPRGGAPYPSKPTESEWNIREDNTIFYKGRSIFPLCIYFARPANWDLVTELGFNMVVFRGDKGAKQWETAKAIEPFYAKAAEKGVTIANGHGIVGRMAQGFDFAFDEPYGYTFEAMRRTYLNLRATRQPTAQLLFGPWREGMKFEAPRELLFDTPGKAELALPPVSSAVYVFGD